MRQIVAHNKAETVLRCIYSNILAAPEPHLHHHRLVSVQHRPRIRLGTRQKQIPFKLYKMDSSHPRFAIMSSSFLRYTQTQAIAAAAQQLSTLGTCLPHDALHPFHLCRFQSFLAAIGSAAPAADLGCQTNADCVARCSGWTCHHHICVAPPTRSPSSAPLFLGCRNSGDRSGRSLNTI